MGQLFQKEPVLLPYDLSDGPDIAFHRFPAGVVLPGHLWVQPFRHQKKMLRLFCAQGRGVSGVEKAGVIGGDAEPVQQDAALRKRRFHLVSPFSLPFSPFSPLLWPGRPAPEVCPRPWRLGTAGTFSLFPVIST